MKPTFNLFGIHAIAAAVACVLAALPAGSARADAPLGPRPVGEVTMSVGPVMKTSALGVPEAVQRGTRILPGDRLDTAEGGHIHVKFVDGALVSVRPGSRLWVEDYRYDPQQIALSAVRFKLEYGVARAISGAAAEGARERFRLNTPLVAIGVRGTDFVVRSGEGGTTALVNQGAIVMAPLDAGCVAQSLGPCGSPGERLLSADMGKLFLEFRAQLAQPELKALNGGTALAGRRNGDQAAPVPLVTASLGQGEAGSVASSTLVEGAVIMALSETVGAVPAPAPAPAPTPIPDVAPPPPALQWGRWASAAAAEGAFVVSRTEAADGRTVTVGDSQFLLYRTQGAEPLLAAGLGGYKFNLGSSFAQYNLAGQISAASVDKAQLTLDFARQRFDTRLTVANALTGRVHIEGSGFIRSDGIFSDRSVPNQVIAGAAALDGKSAGYLFEKLVGAGILSGITLWTRP